MRRLLALLLLLPTCALADSYAGLGLGEITGRQLCRGGAFASGNINCDDSNGALTLVLGQRFHPAVSGELFLAGFGERSFAVRTPAAEFSARAKTWGIGADVLAKLPLAGQSGVFAQAGLFRWRERVDTSGDPSAVGIEFSDDKDGTSFFWGLGFEVSATDRLSLRVQYQKYEDVSDVDYEWLGASVLYYFGGDR